MIDISSLASTRALTTWSTWSKERHSANCYLGSGLTAEGSPCPSLRATGRPIFGLNMLGPKCNWPSKVLLQTHREGSPMTVNMRHHAPSLSGLSKVSREIRIFRVQKMSRRTTQSRLVYWEQCLRRQEIYHEIRTHDNARNANVRLHGLFTNALTSK